MLNFLSKKKQPIAGLEISGSSVKIMQLGLENGRYVIEAFGCAELPDNAVLDKEIKDVEAVSQAIKKAALQAKITTKYFAVGMAGTSVITRVIQIPAGLSEEEILEQIEIEANHYIPYPLDEVNLDFEVLGVYEENAEFVNVQLAAARTQNIEPRLQAITMAGFIPKVVDVEVFAIERAFELVSTHLPNQGKDQRIALFDIGNTTTSLIVLLNKQAIYTRDQAFGGKQLTEEIQRRYGLTFEEAILAKKMGGLPDDYTIEVLEPFKDTVAQQINRALQFFYSSDKHGNIDYIMLAGGTALLPGLEDRVAEVIGIKTFISSPISDMIVSPLVVSDILQNETASLMISCGLALRNFDK
ncbi:MAG: pilus assembly protein PilM [Francisellaceae bacterium]|nr:pilus assembly protein PilM [Francisellaceae bacterium]